MTEIDKITIAAIAKQWDAERPSFIGSLNQIQIERMLIGFCELNGMNALSKIIRSTSRNKASRSPGKLSKEQFIEVMQFLISKFTINDLKQHCKATSESISRWVVGLSAPASQESYDAIINLAKNHGFTGETEGAIRSNNARGVNPRGMKTCSPEVHKIIVDKIAELSNSGMTHKEICQLLGVYHKTIYTWRANLSIPSLKISQRLMALDIFKSAQPAKNDDKPKNKGGRPANPPLEDGVMDKIKAKIDELIKLGLSQTAIAKEANIADTSLSMFLRGKRHLSQKHIKSLMAL